MGKNPWEDPDHEVLALAATMQAKGPKRWLRLGLGLLVIASLTFIAGYYIPLFRAHDALRAEFQQLSERRRLLDEKLRTGEQTVKRLETEKSELQAKLDERQTTENARKQQLDQLSASLDSIVASHERKGAAAASADSDRVRVALANHLVFSANSMTVPGRGTSLLCDIGKQAGSGRLRVVATTSEREPASATLKAKYPSPRELSSARAATVSNQLEKDCGIPGERLEAVGLVEAGKSRVSSVKLPAIVLELLPPEK
jgi:chemotaxis protein MotB